MIQRVFAVFDELQCGHLRLILPMPLTVLMMPDWMPKQVGQSHATGFGRGFFFISRYPR
jgi:hypothetical protein